MTSLKLPSKPNTKSLRFRATVWAGLAVAALVFVGEFGINYFVTRAVEDAFDNTLAEQAQDRARLLDAGADPATLITVVGDEVIAAVIGSDGQVLASAGSPDPIELAAIPVGVRDVDLAVLDDDGGGEGDEEDEEDLSRETLRVAVVAAADGSLVVVGGEGEGSRNTINNVRVFLVIAAPVTALLAALLIRWLTGRALTPVFDMRDDLDGVVRAGSTGRIREPDTGDEIADLAVTMNGVLDDLEQQSVARRRFVADASHELKSPVANARTLIETGGSSDRVLGELDRLQALVDDLLYLARTDETAAPEATLVALDDIVFDEAERAAIRTERHIDASGVQPAEVMADQREVARAVRNLIENATRHAENRVSLAIEPAGEHGWTVVVADDGPGIPPEHRDTIFTRFARLQADRARTEGGTGLGLSIVESIAHRYGGTVVVADSDRGARFELTFPRSAPGPTPG